MADASRKIPVFICHNTPLYERKKHILKELEEYHDEIEVRFINKYDREAITEEVENRFFLENSEEWEKRAMLKPTENNFRPLTKAEQSIAMKHYQAVKEIHESGFEYALVIEDDCVFRKKFIHHLRKVIERLPEDWDVYYPNAYLNIYRPYNVFLTKVKNKACEYIPYLRDTMVDYFKQCSPFSNFSDLHPSLIRVQKQPNQYNPLHQLSFGAYSYLIRHRSCLPIIEYIEKNKIVLPIDWEYGWIYCQEDCKVYIARQAKDTLVTTGFHKSIIQKLNQRT